MKRKNLHKLLAMFMTLILGTFMLSGCTGDVYTESDEPSLSYEDAVSEIDALMTKVTVKKAEAPTLDIYSEETSEKDVLSDINTFPITVQGRGDINLEIAGATEMTSEKAPNDWLNIVAKNFNKENHEINGKSISITVRQMTSGEVVTYMMADAYKPELYLPSAYPWASMLESSGIGMVKLSDGLVGNTAGILMKNDVYKRFIEKYKEPTLANLIKASIAGDVLLAYPNPYTSTTGLNGIGAFYHPLMKKTRCQKRQHPNCRNIRKHRRRLHIRQMYCAIPQQKASLIPCSWKNRHISTSRS